jgi:two-component system, cell cycle response regulator DivK
MTMSLPSSSDQLADLRHYAQLLVERTGDHMGQIEELVASAEREPQQADTPGPAWAAVVEARHRLNGHGQRRAAGAATARQLCVSAREQHAAACRLLTQLDAAQRGGELGTNAVLVVDDYGDVRELVARVLQDAGFIVRTAANGLEGLIAAYEMRPGVIVMDVSMPVLDGIQATRLIKAGEATRNARVIAYTGSRLDTAVVEKLFAAVLEKPSAPDVIVATVQHVAAL